MMVVFSLTTMREFYPVDLSAYGNLLAYLRRLVDRPAYRRYLAKADPDIEIEKFIQGPSPPLFPALAQMQAQAQAASEEK
jgi:glutathione S-transferase